MTSEFSKMDTAVSKIQYISINFLINSFIKLRLFEYRSSNNCDAYLIQNSKFESKFESKIGRN